MSVTSSELNPATESLPAVNSTFRKQYGIPPKGTPPEGGWPDSAYGFPLPPDGHPNALGFAHAVLSRAHQATNFDPADVAKQVRKAQAIVAKHNASKESFTPWRRVSWVDTAKPNARGGFVAVNPRKTETAGDFLERCPGARPKSAVEPITKAQKSIREAQAKGAKMRESAGAVLERGETRLHERDLPSNVAFREAAVDSSTGEIVVKNVVLLREGPGNAVDGHYYSAQCLQESAASGIFEGAQSYLDHPSSFEEQTLPERSVKNLAAWYSNVSCSEYKDPQLGRTVKALYADMHLVVGRADVLSLVRTCVEYAKQYPRKSFAGLSINAAGDSAPGTIGGKSYQVVNRITAVESVDVVTRAGAGGAIVPLKESYRMAKTKTDAQDGVKLVIDGDAVKTGVADLIEKQKTAQKAAIAKLKEAGVTLTDEQIKSLETLSEVDGDTLGKIVDMATGVDDTPAADPTEDDMGGSTLEAEIDSMPDDPAALKGALKTERAARMAAEQKSIAATGKATEANRQVVLEKRDRYVDEAIVERNIPESFRPGCKRYAMRENFSNKADAIKLVNEFDVTYIRRADGAVGNVAGDFRESGNSAKGGNFNFDEEN